MATETKFLSEEWFSMAAEFSGEMRSHVAPPSLGAKYAIERADDQRVVVAGRHGEGANRLAVDTHQLPPSTPAVIRAEDTAFIVVEQSPGRRIHNCRVGGIEDDVIENVIVAGTDVSKNRPRISAVLGNEKLSRAGAQQDAVGIAGIVSQAADVAAFGPDQLPLGCCGNQAEQHPYAEK